MMFSYFNAASIDEILPIRHGHVQMPAGGPRERHPVYRRSSQIRVMACTPRAFGYCLVENIHEVRSWLS